MIQYQSVLISLSEIFVFERSLGKTEETTGEITKLKRGMINNNKSHRKSCNITKTHGRNSKSLKQILIELIQVNNLQGEGEEPKAQTSKLNSNK